MNDDLAFLSVSELTERYKRLDISPVEYTSAVLERISELDPHLNTLYCVDAKGALAQARASEQRYRAGTPLGPLDGVPTSIKDALPLRGMPSFRGSAAPPDEGLHATENAPAVDRLIENGCVILGKNTMCDFGILASGISSRHGVTRNPWDLSKTPGASSSGAAASVAAGFSPFAVGTDIVGSIRLPASYCGLVGLKPSQGRVPYYFPNSPALVAGPLARTVEDAALLLDVLAAPDARDFTALPRTEESYSASLATPVSPNLRIRLITDIGFGVAPSPEIIATVRAAAHALQEAGAIVEEDATPPFNAEAPMVARLFYQTRTLVELESYPEERRPRAALINHWVEPARHTSAADLFRCIDAMQRLRERTVRLMDGYDFLLMPSTPTAAFPAELAAPTPHDPFDAWCNTFLFNLSEQPALSINCGFTSDALPIGLQIVGRRFDDAGVLRLGKRVAELLPHATRPVPPLTWRGRR